MKKIIPTTSLILIALLFNGCSSDLTNNEDAVLFEQVQGKWKLTEYYSDDQPANTPISDGYEIEFKADKTFISNEEDGYTGGTYKVIKSPGKNLQLIFKKQWSSKLVYKYVDAIYDENMFLQSSNPDPIPDGSVPFSGYVLTRIP
jgi:hypothetical protein